MNALAHCYCCAACSVPTSTVYYIIPTNERTYSCCFNPVTICIVARYQYVRICLTSTRTRTGCDLVFLKYSSIRSIFFFLLCLDRVQLTTAVLDIPVVGVVVICSIYLSIDLSIYVSIYLFMYPFITCNLAVSVLRPLWSLLCITRYIVSYSCIWHTSYMFMIWWGIWYHTAVFYVRVWGTKYMIRLVWFFRLWSDRAIWRRRWLTTGRRYDCVRSLPMLTATSATSSRY